MLNSNNVYTQRTVFDLILRSLVDTNAVKSNELHHSRKPHPGHSFLFFLFSTKTTTIQKQQTTNQHPIRPNYYTRLRLLYKARITIQGPDYHTKPRLPHKAQITLEGPDYPRRPSLPYKAQITIQGSRFGGPGPGSGLGPRFGIKFGPRAPK